jgi:hypothetical protein
VHNLYMANITARNTLMAMWPLVYKARTRALSEEEATEVRRLCEVLQTDSPGQSRYNEAVDDLCMSLHSSGIFEGNPTSADMISHKIDQLRELLNGLDANNQGANPYSSTT